MKLNTIDHTLIEVTLNIMMSSSPPFPLTDFERKQQVYSFNLVISPDSDEAKLSWSYIDIGDKPQT